MSDTTSPVTVLAVGGAGCRIIAHLAELPQSATLRLLAVDTDAAALAECGLPSGQTLLAGELWRNGRGCGGNEIDGQRAVAHERPGLERMLSGSRMLLVVGGLGRGTASGGMSVLPGVVSKLKIPAVFLLTLPFSMEGHSMRRRAEKVLNDMFQVADAVVALPNDLLFSTLDSATGLNRAFELADAEVARTALALSEVLASGNLLNADFAGFTAFLKRRKSVCGIGIGVARGEAPDLNAAMEQLLYSPLLGGPSRLSDADAVVLSLLGGPELAIGVAKNAVELMQRHVSEHSRLMVAASSSPAWSGELQLTALAIKFDEKSELAARTEPDSGSRRNRRERGGADPESKPTQLPLPFGEAHAKGIMEGTAPVFFEGEDLDIPTCLRRNVVIDNGRRG